MNVECPLKFIANEKYKVAHLKDTAQKCDATAASYLFIGLVQKIASIIQNLPVIIQNLAFKIQHKTEQWIYYDL